MDCRLVLYVAVAVSLTQPGVFGLKVSHGLLKGADEFVLGVVLIPAIVHSGYYEGHQFLVAALVLPAALLFLGALFAAALFFAAAFLTAFFPVLFEHFLMAALGVGFILQPVQAARSEVEVTGQQLRHPNTASMMAMNPPACRIS